MTDYELIKESLKGFSFTFGEGFNMKWIIFAYGELLTRYTFNKDEKLTEVSHEVIKYLPSEFI